MSCCRNFELPPDFLANLSLFPECFSVGAFVSFCGLGTIGSAVLCLVIVFEDTFFYALEFGL